MGLFKPDLYRMFFIGFLIGTAGLFVSLDAPARARIEAKVSL